MTAVVAGFVPWQPHTEVWLLVGGLVAAYVYMVKVVGPGAVRSGQPVVTRGNLAAFAAAMALLWFASDWPLHDIAEDRLYSAHMLQHMVLSYFVPPLALLATPEWLARAIVGHGKVYRVVSTLAKPVVAGIVFNVVVMVTHIPGVVNASPTNSVLHYSLHVLVVVSSLLMWTPVCGPLPELRIGPGAKMIYLFVMSIVPTVPAGWLTFAEGVVYKVYADVPSLWGFTPTEDQQLAGAIMKVGGSIFLWSIVVFLFFGRFMARWEEQNTYRRSRRVPDAEVVGHDDGEPLTYDEVQAAFQQAEPVEQRPVAGS